MILEGWVQILIHFHLFESHRLARKGVSVLQSVKGATDRRQFYCTSCVPAGCSIDKLTLPQHRQPAEFLIKHQVSPPGISHCKASGTGPHDKITEMHRFLPIRNNHVRRNCGTGNRLGFFLRQKVFLAKPGPLTPRINPSRPVYSTYSRRSLVSPGCRLTLPVFIRPVAPSPFTSTTCLSFM